MSNLVAGSFTNADATYFAAPQTVSSSGQVDAGNGNGLLSAVVDGGLPAGNYRVCTMASSSNHQPVIMPVAQRGTADDCTKFVVTGNGKTANVASNNGSGGQAAAAAAASAVAAGPGAIDTASASAAKVNTGGNTQQATSANKGNAGNSDNANTGGGKKGGATGGGGSTAANGAKTSGRFGRREFVA